MPGYTPPPQRNEDELKVMGLIAFISLLVGGAIAIFDARLWLRMDDSVYTNALTYTMGAFTLQGISYFIYKMLMQDSMDNRAVYARQQKDRDRKIMHMQQMFSNRQMEQELRLQELQLEAQLRMMENDPEVLMRGLAYSAAEPPREEFAPAPKHEAKSDKPLDLGASKVVEEKTKEEVNGLAVQNPKR